MNTLPVGVVALVALAAGCAVEPARPTEETTRAHALIDQAEQTGAQRYAAADLQEARDKLQQSDSAATRGDAIAARRLASEASIDAQLASARTQSAKEESAASEVDRGLDTLRSEAAAHGDDANAPPPPPPPPSSPQQPQ